MKFLRSLKCAFRGIIYCINNERNFRIHTAIAFYVLYFAAFFNFSKIQYMILLLVISSVITAEMCNSIVEKLCDNFFKNYSPLIKTVKDIAAGMVLFCSVFSAIIGLCLFYNPPILIKIFYYFIDNRINFLLLILSFAASFIYISISPAALIKTSKEFIIKKLKRRNARGNEL
jgi:diacylglycerol kinase (ATP)